MQLLIVIFFALYGLLIGSFLNVCIYRLPRGLNITTDRSHCTSCGHTLTAFDLIPVASYLFLGRKCRYCHNPISGRYALIELLTMLVYTLLAIVFKPNGLDIQLLKAAAYAIAFSVFIVWGMIRFDGARPTRKTYIFMFALAALSTLLDDKPLLMLIGMISMLVTSLLLYLLKLWQVQTEHAGHEIIATTACGLYIAWPGTSVVAAILVITLAIMNIWKNSRPLSTSNPGRWLGLLIITLAFAGVVLRESSIPWFY
ncbi:MAG: prepilin peptidase [Eubacteriales bacterium]|nr:prepilin peptidase [Eubacteriales bacterium]MDD3196711.1 prepilin peptidase [Eubacteriales bacterium]MDD3503563.1 prepilin peptidase [Eubacteriales bacterium]MDD4681967.1 prepilin peptidase [Eubacteriales bacterium]